MVRPWVKDRPAPNDPAEAREQLVDLHGELAALSPTDDFQYNDDETLYYQETLDRALVIADIFAEEASSNGST